MKKVTNVMRCLTGRDCGASRSLLKRMYVALIRSVVDYGNVMYGSAARSHEQTSYEQTRCNPGVESVQQGFKPITRGRNGKYAFEMKASRGCRRDERQG